MTTKIKTYPNHDTCAESCPQWRLFQEIHGGTPNKTLEVHCNNTLFTEQQRQQSDLTFKTIQREVRCTMRTDGFGNLT